MLNQNHAASNSAKLEGMRFGRLVVVSRAGSRVLVSGEKTSTWVCRCDCGTEVEYTYIDLINNKKTDCGCGLSKPYETVGRKARPKQIVDMAGKKCGRLTVIGFEGVSKAGAMWRCICDCGTECIVSGRALRNGHTTSCGCLRLERAVKAATTHGHSKERLYRVWADIKQRCLNKKNPSYPAYGGRGIRLCDEWLEYEGFRNWALSTGYNSEAAQGECTIERIDVDGNYEPSNCTWITLAEQAQNRRPQKKTAPQHYKAIVVVDERDNVLETYESVKSAASAFGCSPTSVSTALHGRQKTVRGRRVRFATNGELEKCSGR